MLSALAIVILGLPLSHLTEGRAQNICHPQPAVHPFEESAQIKTPQSLRPFVSEPATRRTQTSATPLTAPSYVRELWPMQFRTQS